MEKKNWFNQTISEAEQFLETNLKTGLTSEQVKERQERYGLNELKEQKKKSLFQKFLAQFKDFSIIILIIAAIISGIVNFFNLIMPFFMA